MALNRKPHITRKMVAITWPLLFTLLWFAAYTHFLNPALMCELRVYMHEEENRWNSLFFWRTREGDGGLARMSSFPPRHSRGRQREESTEGSGKWRKEAGRKERSKVGREVWREGDIPNDNLPHVWRTQELQLRTSTPVLNFIFLMYQKEHVFCYIITNPSVDIWQTVLMPQAATIIVVPVQAVDTLMGINKPDQCMLRFTTTAEKLSK